MPLQPTPRFNARILKGRDLADGGDLDGAEHLFRDLLVESRGGHEGNLATALISLITVYGRAGRYLEAHLLARQLAVLAVAALAVATRAGESADAERLLGFAQGAVCGALGQLRLFEPLVDGLSALRSTLDGMSKPAPPLECKYHSAATLRAVATGDQGLARRHIDAYRSIVDRSPALSSVYHWALCMSEIRVLRIEGRSDAARQLLANLQASELTPPFHRLQELPLAVSVLAACGRTDEALHVSIEAIEILESVRDHPFLASDRIHQGNLLARELEALDASSHARRVHDLIAAAVMIRLRQVDECTAAMPELGIGDPESTLLLAGFRKQFLKEQQALLGRVAQLLKSQGTPFIQSLLTSSAPSGLIAICAWCESVRPSVGRWLPIGHFIPREGSIEVTHGICPDCAATVMAG